MSVVKNLVTMNEELDAGRHTSVRYQRAFQYLMQKTEKDDSCIMRCLRRECEAIGLAYEDTEAQEDLMRRWWQSYKLFRGR